MARAQPGLLASGRYFLVEENGQVLGAGGWSAEEPRGRSAIPGVAHVRHVATDARATRRGVGRLLMERVFDEASAAGMRQLLCLSTLTAVPFYEALGFRASSPLTLRINGVPFPVVEMMRPL
jgi:GNAT superfamily N-acetyltransferase